MTAPHYDDKDWPLFRATVPRTEMDDDEFMAFVTTLDELPLRGGKFAVLLDVRASPPLSATRRQLLGERGNASYARYPGAMTGMAIVMSSAIQRGIFTAIHWMMRQPQQVKAFASIGEAETWLRARLRESGTRSLVSNE
ncbi:MAG TPA: STAS/SEC14 domain-containing protein [Polyangiaceae bacterium]|nr:STAS/SEC14 domain-containing protein [Polyangiaceae bacterium]